MQDGTYIVVGDKYIDKPYDNTCSIKDFIEENYDKLKPLPQDEQQIETEIDIKQGISEQSKKWEDRCNAYNQERINKLAEEIKAKQEELRGCDEISNIVSSGYKAL